MADKKIYNPDMDYTEAARKPILDAGRKAKKGIMDLFNGAGSVADGLEKKRQEKVRQRIQGGTGQTLGKRIGFPE